MVVNHRGLKKCSCVQQFLCNNRWSCFGSSGTVPAAKWLAHHLHANSTRRKQIKQVIDWLTDWLTARESSASSETLWEVGDGGKKTCSSKYLRSLLQFPLQFLYVSTLWRVSQAFIVSEWPFKCQSYLNQFPCVIYFIGLFHHLNFTYSKSYQLQLKGVRTSCICKETK